MKIIFFLLTFIICTPLFAQDKSKDLDLISGSDKRKNDKSVVFKGALKVYNDVFTDQILNDCIYEHSCSTFSQHAFDEYGLIKGLFLTCDRLMRCNRATLAETSKFQLTRKGRIKDHWNDYQKPH